MYSNFSRSVVGAALFISLTSCSLYEGPPTKRDDAFEKSDLNCMKNMRATLIQYSEGRANSADVNRIAECSIGALDTFAKYTRGETRDRFTAIEIRSFLQRYFFEDLVISDGLLTEIMHVKQAFLGGSSTDFSREDLSSAKDVINALRATLLRLQLSMPLTLSRFERENTRYVDEASLAIIDAAEILAKKISENKTTYSFEDMGRLLDQIMGTFSGSQSILTTIRSHLELAGIIKELVIAPGKPREIVTSADWRLIVQEGSKWGVTYLKFLHLQAQYKDWMRGEGRERLGILLMESLDHLDRIAARSCPKCTTAPGIPISSLQHLLEHLKWNGKILDIQFDKNTLAGLFTPVIQHVLGGSDKSETGRGSDRLTLIHISRLRSMVQDVLDGTRFLEASYATLIHVDHFSDLEAVTTQDLVSLDAEEILRKHGGVNESALQVAKGLQDVFRKTVALGDHTTKNALYDGRNASRPRTYREMIRYVWLRPIFKKIVDGYRTNGRAGLNLSEFQGFIQDYWPILKDFKLVGPKNNPKDDGIKRFREASLFTQVSDGNDLIAVDEGLMLVLYMFSANPMSIDVHNRMTSICPIGDFDDYGKRTVEPTCYRNKLYNFSRKNLETSDLWKSFPVMITYYEGLKPKDQVKFQQYIESTVRKVGVPSTAYFGSDDSQTLVMMFHYIEGLFLRYDTNFDTVLNRAEAQAAFPVFQSTLATLGEMELDDKKLPSAFYWLLSRGAPPVDDQMSWLSLYWHGFNFWIWHKRAPEITADRLSVLKVFSTLSKTPSPASAP